MPQVRHSCTNKWYAGGPSLWEVYQSCTPCRRWLEKQSELIQFAVRTQKYENW